jgi:hypothetical protein
MREEGLLSLVSAIASDGQIPPERLFEAFSTEPARQNGILGAISMLTMRNRAGARELYETGLTDPQLRQRAEALLDGPRLEPGQQGGLFRPIPTPADR